MRCYCFYYNTKVWPGYAGERRGQGAEGTCDTGQGDHPRRKGCLLTQKLGSSPRDWPGNAGDCSFHVPPELMSIAAEATGEGR